MEEPIISYEALVERALRGVLREALQLTQKDGLPGGHHFYITFATEHPDVDIPPRLRAAHPQEMTIVLQHQFWNLEVNEDSFSVELSFQNKVERLFIPFEAVTAFADPFAKFGLQFRVDADVVGEEFGEELAEDDDLMLEEFPGDSPAPESAGEKTAERGEGEEDNVVALDAFRKK